MPYIVVLSAANMTTLATNREEILMKFFSRISKSISCLHHVLVDPREDAIISRLRIHEQ